MPIVDQLQDILDGAQGDYTYEDSYHRFVAELNLLIRELRQIKIYFVFIGDDYYPGKPEDDYVASFKDLSEAKEFATTKLNSGEGKDWAQILTIVNEDLKVVSSCGRNYGRLGEWQDA